MGDGLDEREPVGNRAYVAHNIYQNIPSGGGGGGRRRGDGPFDTWINLPATRRALNVAGTFPSDVKWGGMPWSHRTATRPTTRPPGCCT
eukprot:SAG22_NODE_3882_length_1485_cov_0.966089_3_plen_89_part_00